MNSPPYQLKDGGEQHSTRIGNMDCKDEWIWDGRMLHIDKPVKRTELPDSIEIYEKLLWWDRNDRIL